MPDSDVTESKNWEPTFNSWAQSPSKTEEERCENAVKAIRNAVARSPVLQSKSVKVFPQGSYRNRVNVRADSDVDVGVMWHDGFLPRYPEGMTGDDFGNREVDYTFVQFKNELEEALVAHFGRAAVHRGNKAFDIKETSYHVEADVVPLFEFRQYFPNKSYRCGVVLRPDNGGQIENYPEKLLESWPDIPQHYENGVSKNTDTRRAYKGTVRILKKLRNEMEDAGIASANPIPGFLVECLTWNAPNSCFSHDTWEDDVRAVLLYLWSNTKEDETCKEWCEVNDIKYLFRSSQKWTRAQSHAFVNDAWDCVGV